jgi:hypothetical protein
MRHRQVVGMSAVGSAAALYLLVGRRRQLGWGTTGHESFDPIPGDELIQDADLIATRAITIAAPTDRVWPWLAQLGQGRGGFYSYDFLENLVGCNIHSADRIVAEWQDIELGDEVRLAPLVGLRVAALERGRSVVLRGGIPIGNRAPPYDFTWAFVLQSRPDQSTRLLVRERYAVLPAVGSTDRRAGGSRQFRDEPEDAARDQEPRRTNRGPALPAPASGKGMTGAGESGRSLGS